MSGEEVCGRALKALLNYWPELAYALIAQPVRGLGIVASAIDIGLILADTAGLPGVQPVIARLRAGEQSAFSELTVGATISRLGFQPSFGVVTGTTVPDLALTVEQTTIFLEVIAPDRAEIVQAATKRIEEIAASLASVSSGANVELFLDCDFEEVDLSALTNVIAQAAFSEDIQLIPAVGRFLKRSYVFPPVISPTVPNTAPGTVMGASRGVGNGATGGYATVRARVFDGRAKRKLGEESHHFQKSNPNVLVINTGRVVGGVQDWVPSIERCFQPTQNTRFSAVILYYSVLAWPPLDFYRIWKILINSYAVNPLPAQFLDALDTLPTTWPGSPSTTSAQAAQ